MGIGIVENAYDRICHLEAIPAADIMQRELELIEMQRGRMPKLPVDAADVLIIDRIGKNISGTCLDTNIIGRMMVPGMEEPTGPHIKMITVHSFTPESHGNCLGIGLADITTEALADTIDRKSTYENLYTASFFVAW